MTATVRFLWRNSRTDKRSRTQAKQGNLTLTPPASEDLALPGLGHERIPHGEGLLIGEPERHAGVLGRNSGCDHLVTVKVEDDSGAVGGLLARQFFVSEDR